MKISRKGTIATAISLFLMLAMVISLFSMPAIVTVKAVSVEDFGITMYAFITVGPNPVGVGQRALIAGGFTLPTLDWLLKCYSGWTITVTKPDETEQTLGPFTSDATGTFFSSFTADTAGIWKFQAHYPGGYADFLGGMNVQVPAADSNVFSLTVQEEPIPWVGESYVPPTPLPTEYWEYPIYGENREWQSIGGNWLMPGYDSGATFGTIKSMYAPYNPVPDTSHILWAKPTVPGGVVGDTTDMTYYTGSIYRGELQPPVVINGRLYYNQMEIPRTGFYCVDIHTGETIWHNNATYPDGKGGLIQGADAQITLGQILTVNTRNWHGGMPFLWSTRSTTWGVWDPWTGDLMYTIVNAPAIDLPMIRKLTFVRDPSDGTLIYYRYDIGTNTLAKWNSTKMMEATLKFGLGRDGLAYAFAFGWPVYNLDWNSGIEWNVTSPVRFTPFVGSSPIESFHDPKDDSTIILTNQTAGLIISATAFENVAISSEDGSVLWRKVRDEGTWESAITSGVPMSMEDDVYAIYRKETRQWYAYRVSTGNELWVSDPYPSQWAVYSSGSVIAYGKLYVTGYDGKVWAHDVQTGDVVWDWGPVSSGLEMPYGHYPLYGGILVADNKVIVINDEHSQQSPLYRGQRMYVIDAGSGQTLWSISGVYDFPIAANSYVLGPNGYDGRLYAFGKGPSSTTVTAAPEVTVHGDSVLVKGSVTDISAGTKQNEQAARFPSGVPAVSNESMTAWMEYVYMQKPRPINATGVDVVISVLDPNNNLYEVGRATSDSSGFYKLAFTPEVPGEYTIIATFEGSESYWGSYAETAINVEEVPAATPAPTATPAPMTDMYVLGIGTAILIAVIIGFVVVILIFRKR
jgi:hypothetical protein